MELIQTSGQLSQKSRTQTITLSLPLMQLVLAIRLLLLLVKFLRTRLFHSCKVVLAIKLPQPLLTVPLEEIWLSMLTSWGSDGTLTRVLPTTLILELRLSPLPTLPRIKYMLSELAQTLMSKYHPEVLLDHMPLLLTQTELWTTSRLDSSSRRWIVTILMLKVLLLLILTLLDQLSCIHPAMSSLQCQLSMRLFP